MERNNIGTVLLTTIIAIFVLSYIALKVVGFETAVIFAISLSAGFVMSGLIGIENIIILTREDKERRGK